MWACVSNMSDTHDMCVLHWPAPFCRISCVFSLKKIKNKKTSPVSMGGTQTKQKFGPWPWLCCAFCNIMFIPWFSLNLSHILISLRNDFLAVPQTMKTDARNITRRDIWPLETTFGHLRENTVYASISLPFETFVKIVTRKWPVLMFTFWPAHQISYVLPVWFHFHNVSHSKLMFRGFFGCLFVKFRFLKFQSHIYAFNLKSIMMALRIH